MYGIKKVWGIVEELFRKSLLDSFELILANGDNGKVHLGPLDYVAYAKLWCGYQEVGFAIDSLHDYNLAQRK